MLMRRHCHDGHLFTDNESSASKSDEDLAHDDVANIGIRLAGMNHQADGQDGDRDTKVKTDPLETSIVSNDNTNDQSSKGAARRLDRRWIANFHELVGVSLQSSLRGKVQT